MRSRRPVGRSLGVAGGSLDGSASWARNAAVARIGRQGERRTAALLDAACIRPGGATVLHDLTVPGCRANIDHLVVTGRRVWIVDTKVWRRGFYWRVGGRAYRGLARFEPAETRTTAMAVDRLARYLHTRGIEAHFAEPTVVVWPSSPGAAVSTLLLRRVGTTPVVGGRGFGWAVASMIGHRRLRRTADPALVAALARLLVTADLPAGRSASSSSRAASVGALFGHRSPVAVSLSNDDVDSASFGSAP